MATKSVQQRLQTLVDELTKPEHYKFEVYRKSDGYYLIPDETRWLGDKGDYIGPSFEEAEKEIRLILS